MKRQALGALLACMTASAHGENEAIPTVEIVGVGPAGTLVAERRLLPYAVQLAARPRQGETLAETMSRTLAGVNLNEVSGSPYQHDVVYRGFRASPLLGAAQGLSVYLDGVRVNEPFGDVVNWDMLPEAAIGQIMLAPGSNPLYGLNTLGGALVLATRNGMDDPGGSISATVAGHGRLQLDLSHGVHSADGWHSFAAATLFRDRGWRTDSPGRLARLFAKAGRRAGASDWDVSVLAGGSSLTGNGLLPDGLYQADRRAVYTSPDRSRNQLRQVQASLRLQPGAGAQLSLSTYVRSSRRDGVNGDLAEPDTDTDAGEDVALPASFNTALTRQHSQGASASLQRDAGAHRLAMGAAFDRSSVLFAQYSQAGGFDAARQALALPGSESRLDAAVDGTARSAALFASDTWLIDQRWSMTASARYAWALVANNLRHGEVWPQRERFTYRKLNPALGLAYQLAPGITLFANASQSNRVPTVIELGCADPAHPCRLPVGLQSDPYLEQVVARTIEAGARRRQGNQQFALALYRTQNRNDILFRAAGVSQHGYFANFPRTLHQGADMTAAFQAGQLQLDLAYSFLDAVYGGNGSIFTGTRAVPVRKGTPLAGLPRHTFKLGAEWHATAALSLGADVQAVSRLAVMGNEDGARPAWRVAGHTLVGLHARYRPNGTWEWHVRVNNAANRRYESFGAVGNDFFSQSRPLQARFVAPGAPRSVMAGLRIDF